MGGYARLMVFDNGSTDGTQEWLRDQQDVAFYDRPGANLYRMWNEMRDYSPGDCAILNNDVSFDAGFFERLHEVLHSSEEVGIAFPTVDGDGLIPGEIQHANWFTGYAFVVKDHPKMPRFDERYLWWYGDTDYAAATRAAGLKIAMACDVRIRHIGGASTPDGLVSRTVGHDRELFDSKWPSHAR